ncbi:MAG: M18 family aminopeptidase [Myxococcota bacterium]
MHFDQDPLRLARDLTRFIDASPSPYHAVEQVERRLVAEHFIRFDEGESWELTPGTRGFVVRGATLLAFVIGSRPPAEAGFIILGAHTDSPNLRIKPRSEFENVGFRQLAVEVYGSPILATWSDRDLGLAGRVVLADATTHLVRLNEPVLRIPNLAIHLNRDVNKDGLTLNAQQHLTPILGLDASKPRSLLELVCADLRQNQDAGIDPSDILGFDLCLFDLQPSTLAGSAGEFIFAPRLDNLASCHAAYLALLAAGAQTEATRVIALYDHEEVGSQSEAGARSRLLESVLDRLATSTKDAPRDATARAFSRSFLVSCDMAHGVHPNYPDKHDKLHRPLLGQGPVIKTNANQSYATDAPAAARFTRACRKNDLTPQHFVSRNDMPCGSTIGPITAARLAINSVDVGNPMLSMHSCREMAASADIPPMLHILTTLLQER